MVIPPMLDINGHGRLVSSSSLNLGYVGRIDSVVALFDVSQFAFIFDDFVFELGERNIFYVGISLDLFFFSAFSAVGRPFYVVYYFCPLFSVGSVR